MANKLHSDAIVPPIMETVTVKDMSAPYGDLEAATKTITATSEAAGLGNATYSRTGALGPAPITDTRFAILNIVTALLLTIDSDDGTHDLRCRVYCAVQDADHMLFDISCTTIGAQEAAQNLNSTTLATLFNLIKAGASHTYYFYLWSPGNHSPVVSVVNNYVALGASSTATTGIPVFSFTSPVVCELQVRQMGTSGSGTSTSYAFINGVVYMDAGFAITDAGALTINGTTSSSPGSWTWQILPASNPFTINMKGSSATSFYMITDLMFYVKRWD